MIRMLEGIWQDKNTIFYTPLFKHSFESCIYTGKCPLEMHLHVLRTSPQDIRFRPSDGVYGMEPSCPNVNLARKRLVWIIASGYSSICFPSTAAQGLLFPIQGATCTRTVGLSRQGWTSTCLFLARFNCVA